MVLLMGLFTVLPRCNSDYLGHGGLGWFLIPLGFLVALTGLSITVARPPTGRRFHVFVLSVVSLGVYALTTLGLTVAGAHSMAACSPAIAKAALVEQWRLIWALFFFPFTYFTFS